MLISSLDLNVYQIVKKVHEFNGVVILAHVMAKRYGIYEVYHGIPDDLNYDGIEVESIKQLNELKQLCKHLKDDYVFFNSDAHNLESIRWAKSIKLIVIYFISYGGSKMQEIAMSTLDIAYNSIRANASLIKILIHDSNNLNILFNIRIIDNGKGMETSNHQKSC